jgi:archaellum component FlaC
MSFTVEDFHDLIELLAQHPEWRAELRRHVLSDELLELPSLVRQLVEAQTRTEARLERVEARLDRLEATVQALAEAQARAEARLERVEARLDRLEATVQALVEAQARAEARLERAEARLEGVEARLEHVEARLERVEARLERVEDRLDRLEITVQALAEAQNRAAQEIAELAVAQRRSEDRLGLLDGEMLEWNYARHAPSYFGSIVRGLRVIEPAALADLLEAAVDDGRLTWDERSSIMLSDLVMSGRRRDTGQDIYLVAEISAGIRPYDVERAADRAALLEKLGRPVLPIVAGRDIDEGTSRLAHSRGVWSAQGGRVEPPRSA